jgi:hypothetical protein
MSKRVLVVAGVLVAAAAGGLWFAVRRPPAPIASSPRPPEAPDPAAPAPPAATGGRPAPALRTATAADAAPPEEPAIAFGRFKGWTKSHWRAWYGERIAQMKEDRARADALIERAERGEEVDRGELGQAHMRVRDLTMRIEFDERDLEEMERSR